MIALTESLPEIKTQSVSLIRIKCAFAAYGAYPRIALFWQQKTDDTINAVLCLLDGNLTVFARNVNEELILFVKSLAPNTVFADEQTALKLGVKGQRVCTAQCLCRGGFQPEQHAKLREIYEIFSNEFDIKKDEFIADLSHRIRHGAAFCLLEENGAAVVQTAGDTALITGICIRKSHRKKGAGSELLAEIKNVFSGELFVCCEDGVLPFYLKNSFEPTGSCIIGRI